LLRRPPGKPIHLTLHRLAIKAFPAHRRIGRAIS
jgi:hypothetical protein